MKPDDNDLLRTRRIRLDGDDELEDTAELDGGAELDDTAELEDTAELDDTAELEDTVELAEVLEPGEVDPREPDPEVQLPETRLHGPGDSPCEVCRLVLLIGSDDAVAAARFWATERAGVLGGCFFLWEVESADTPFQSLSVRDVSGGRLRPRHQFARASVAARSRFHALHPELAHGGGRFREVVIFQHGRAIDETRVVQGLHEILVENLRIPVCRLVYWAQNAAVEPDTGRGAWLDVTMAAFGALSRESACGCAEPVELYLPTAGRCALSAPDQPLSIFSADGYVRRLRWGYRQRDSALGATPDATDRRPTRSPDSREGDTIRGTVLGVPVVADPALR